MGPLIEVRDLEVFYRTRRGSIRAVDRVNLEIQEGEALGLVGESGCGKSTLGKALLGILPPRTAVRGEILYKMPDAARAEMERVEGKLRGELEPMFDGHRLDVFDARAIQWTLRELRSRGQTEDGLTEGLKGLLEVKLRYDLTTFRREAMRRMRGEKVVLIFQDPMSRLDPLMSVRDHFLELLSAHQSLSKREAERRALEALSSVGIPPTRLRNYPHEFSGGMRQRIMIAMGLVMNPELLVADEPTTSLDVLVEGQILELIEELKQSLNMSLFLITHNLGIVAETCDRVGVMYAGKVVEVSETSRIFAEPRHPYTHGLLYSFIHLGSQELLSIEGAPPDLLDPPTGCRFHPRCPRVMDICRTKEPPHLAVDDGSVACFLYGGQDD
ncbi:MAG: ABC transporter ATP-binding protein [Candidatus Thermoplasmatota archaeon]|nr:ABC transporter ATP-binding protein [Candidatus Thermoplasmatota archaeon]